MFGGRIRKGFASPVVCVKMLPLQCNFAVCRWCLACTIVLDAKALHFSSAQANKEFGPSALSKKT
jgi:hypothetical protein